MPAHQSIDVHAPSTAQALLDEHEYAAHNYHPLPVVFARAEGARVWDPEVCILFYRFVDKLFGYDCTGCRSIPPPVHDHVRQAGVRIGEI